MIEKMVAVLPRLEHTVQFLRAMLQIQNLTFDSSILRVILHGSIIDSCTNTDCSKPLEASATAERECVGVGSPLTL